MYICMKFKDNVYTENYVKYCKNMRRSLIAQFRFGILPLHMIDSETNIQKKEFVLFVIQV